MKIPNSKVLIALVIGNSLQKKFFWDENIPKPIVHDL